MMSQRESIVVAAVWVAGLATGAYVDSVLWTLAIAAVVGCAAGTALAAIEEWTCN